MPDVRTTLRLAKKEWYMLRLHLVNGEVIFMIKGSPTLKAKFTCCRRVWRRKTRYSKTSPVHEYIHLPISWREYDHRVWVILTISCEYSIRRHTDLNPKFLWSSRWCSYVSQLPSRSPTLRPERCNSSCSHLYARDLVDLMSKAASASNFFNLPFRQFYF